MELNEKIIFLAEKAKLQKENKIISLKADQLKKIIEQQQLALDEKELLLKKEKQEKSLFTTKIATLERCFENLNYYTTQTEVEITKFKSIYVTQTTRGKILMFNCLSWTFEG